MKTNIKIAGILLIAFILALITCKKDENLSSPQTTNNEMTSERGTNPDPANIFRPGYVYTESNAKDVNEIFIYAQQSNGSLKFQSAVKTGGIGNGTALNSQGAVVLDQHHVWLYAVNAGDNSISAFRIIREGELKYAGKVSSMGNTPVSLTTHDNLLYVVNAGSDNIQGYNTGADANNSFSAHMIPIEGSGQKLSTSGVGAAEIAFSPNGAFLFVTEKVSSRISSFYVDENGIASLAYINQSAGKTPFGFAFAGETMAVGNAANDVPGVGSASSYAGDNTGTLTARRGPVFNNQTSSSRIAVAHSGRHAYVTNTHSNTVSVYLIGTDGKLSLLFPAIACGMEPTDLIADVSDIHVYVLCPGEQTIRQYVKGSDGFLTGMAPNNAVYGLPPAAAGLATFAPGIF